MIEELQKTTIFLSKANQALKVQNDDLTRRLQDARSELTKLGEPVDTTIEKLFEAPAVEKPSEEMESSPNQGATQGAPTVTASTEFPQLQPGSTMQEMANFQQAAAMVMQAAAQGMQAMGVLNGETNEVAASQETITI